MTAIPPPDNTTVNAIYAHYEAREEAPREYLGWSEIGHECDRYLWLKFRMAFTDKIEGRIRRLFETGHLEEVRVLNNLESIGCKVQRHDPETGRQIAVSSHGGHMRGHLDAIVSQMPEAPKTKHLVDVKTINKKRMDLLIKNGMEKEYPKYWAQAHGYMGHMKLTRAIFIFVYKDDDRLHSERFEYDKAVMEHYEARAGRVIFSDSMPPPISHDPSWYQCKFCPAHDFCHQSKLTKEVNCRTCAHSTAMPDGGWKCERFNFEPIPFENQMTGCEAHVLHPEMTPWKRLPSDSSNEAMYEIDGQPVRNGEPDAFTFSSKEIIANPSACANPSELMQDVKRMWPGAEVVG